MYKAKNQFGKQYSNRILYGSSLLAEERPKTKVCDLVSNTKYSYHMWEGKRGESGQRLAQGQLDSIAGGDYHTSKNDGSCLFTLGPQTCGSKVKIHADA